MEYIKLLGKVQCLKVNQTIHAVTTVFKIFHYISCEATRKSDKFWKASTMKTNILS